MYLWDSFILQSFKKILRADPELWGCAIYRPKIAHLSWIKFFWYKPLLFLSSTYWPFSLCKILKYSYSGSRVRRMHHFWAQHGPFLPKKYFFENYYYSHLPISPFHCAKFLKHSSCRSRVMRIHNSWAQNGLFAQMRIFSENLLLSLVSLIHTYLHAKIQSQILIY